MEGKQEMKVCSICMVEKDINEFHKSKKTLDGYVVRCKSCVSAYYKGYNASRKAANARVDIKSKVCRDCHLEKPISQFGKRATSLDKYNIYCKPCWRTRTLAAIRRMRNGRKTKESK